MAKAGSFWQMVASRWQKLGTPLRPSEEDQEIVKEIVHNWISKNGQAKILLLGVTPELAKIDIPEDTELLAADYCQEMLDHVWPDLEDPNKNAIVANWLDLPLEDHSRDLVISDGPFGAMRYPDDFRSLLKSVSRVLQPGGLFIFRIFIKPDPPEDPHTVYEDALNGNISDFSTFQYRLVTALQPDTESGTNFNDVYLSWKTDGPDPEKLADNTGWSMENIQKFETYRGSDFVFTFPSLKQLRDLITAEGFKELECIWPSYEFGNRCPTIICTPDAKNL